MRALAPAVALLFGLAFPSCAPPEAPSAMVRMDFQRATSVFEAPFPSADLLDDDGTVRVGGLPTSTRPIVMQVEQALVGLRGFGATSAVHFALTEPPDETTIPSRPTFTDTTAVVQLVDVDPGSPNVGERIPLEVYYADDAGPYGDHAHMLTLLPVQGWPLRANTTYAAVVLDTLLTTTGNRYAPSPAMRALRDHRAPDGISAAAGDTYVEAVMALGAHDIDIDHVVGMTVYRTQDPTRLLERAIESVRTRGDALTLDAPFTLETTYDDYCVFHSTVTVPVYQAGEPPYAETGGGWVFDQTGALVLQHMEQANVLVTLPRRAMPTDGFPMVTLVRTGAGGDRPLVDRGIDTMPHAGAPPGTGPAMHFAREGIAGIQIDGPHGGLRNVTHSDEQFLVFNIRNPTALRDNLRQSALELDLLVDFAAGLRIDPTGCDGLTTSAAGAHIDVRQLVLMGHSMGASIAPLAAAFEPRYRALILSGAGASWLENVIYKQSPLAVRPIAESFLGYTGHDPRTLREDDPVVNWLQWAGEEADAAVYAPLLIREGGQARHILLFQGIVDTYILPPIANPMTMATGLDLAGPALDRDEPRLVGFQSIREVLPRRGRTQQGFPVMANLPTSDGGHVTGAVVQHRQDAIEDGHEVMWQLPEAQTQYRCFLRTFLREPAPSIVDPSVGCP